MRGNANKRRIAILIGLLLVALAWWLWFSKSNTKPTAVTTPTSVVGNTNQQTNTVATAPGAAGQPTSVPPRTNTPGPLQEAKAAVEGKNVPIRFWGRVVDQDDAPLANVEVRAKVRSWHLRGLFGGQGRFTLKEAVSGRDGRFEITDAKGDVLTIEALEKEGYEPERLALRSFGYNISANHSPDFNNPVVFRLWRADVKAELITGDKFSAIIPDGRVYTIDLARGITTESPTGPGDLRLWVKRPQDVSLGQRYDWSCGLEAVEGGLLEESDRSASMSLAPPEGYVKSWEFHVRVSDGKWGDRLRRRFYVKTRGQNYGQLEIDVFAFYDREKRDGSLGLKYAVNPSGSRILR